MQPVFDAACVTMLHLEDSEGTVSLGVCVFLIGSRLVDHALISVLCMQLFLQWDVKYKQSSKHLR